MSKMERRTGAAAIGDELRSNAVGVLRAMLAADRLGLADYERAVHQVLSARTETELDEVLRSLPSPVTVTPPDRRLDQPLKIRGGTGRLRLDRPWQLARQTSVRAELGSVLIDLTQAQFDERTIDLSVYTGWGTITIVVPPGVGIQLLRSHGTVSSRIAAPLPGLPVVRLRAQTNIGRIRLRTPDDVRRRRLPPLPRRRRPPRTA
jgi:hypothetical protein